MPYSLTTTIDRVGDGVSVRRWFAIYGLLLAFAVAWLTLTLHNYPHAMPRTWSELKLLLPQAPSTVKLLAMGIYLSLCCTFLPMNTNWIVAAVATREVAVGSGQWDTVLQVGLVGAAASAVANLHDYHLMTWMLRSRRIARIRQTRIYRSAAKWFARSPFFLLVIFNVMPVPVDVVRILATTRRYPRMAFTAANFIGRFMRYAAIALVIYCWALSLEVAVAIMLALTVVLATARLAPSILARIRSGS